MVDLKRFEKKLHDKAFGKSHKKKFTIVDINRAGFNLEPTICRHCKKSAFFNFGMRSVICEHCGLIDSGSSIKKQMREQDI